jgi:hypothetical protein
MRQEQWLRARRSSDGDGANVRDVASWDKYIHNVAFWLKLLFIAAAGVNALGFYVSGLHRRVDATEPWQDVPFVAKLVGATSLLLWIGVMYWGRMLPFIGNAF